MSHTFKKKTTKDKLSLLQAEAVNEARKGHYGKLLDCLMACSRGIMVARAAARMGETKWSAGMVAHYMDLKEYLLGQIMHDEVKVTAIKICDKIEGK
jgi:hypothetical protein